MAKQSSSRSLLSEYQQKQQLLDQLRDELQALESDQRLTSELEFKNKLEDLMASHKKQPADVIEILDPTGELTGQAVEDSNHGNTGQRRKRKLKRYTNPHNGEVVETRGGNHRQLKAWKDEYGTNTVESWLEETEAA